jgi:type I restriction enzyme R subunit
MNQNVKTADITELMVELQGLVNESIIVKDNTLEEKEGVYVDLSKLDFQKLKAAFEKAPRKNTMTFDLQQAIERKLQQMLKENPLRLEFYERYQHIISEYNAGKSLENTVRAFEKLSELIQSMSEEEQRAVRENLGDQETLAIFDLLKEGKELDSKALKEVKKVAKQTLDKLKAEKLKIDRWREKREITAQVKSMIYDQLLWLPQDAYSDEEVSLKTVSVYQHIYSNYYGGGSSVYQRST